MWDGWDGQMTAPWGRPGSKLVCVGYYGGLGGELRTKNVLLWSLTVTDGHWDGHWDGHCMAPARSTSTISKTLDPLLPPFFTRSARNTAASTVPSAYTLRPLTLC